MLLLQTKMSFLLLQLVTSKEKYSCGNWPIGSLLSCDNAKQVYSTDNIVRLNVAYNLHYWKVEFFPLVFNLTFYSVLIQRQWRFFILIFANISLSCLWYMSTTCAFLRNADQVGSKMFDSFLTFSACSWLKNFDDKKIYCFRENFQKK